MKLTLITFASALALAACNTNKAPATAPDSSATPIAANVDDSSPDAVAATPSSGDAAEESNLSPEEKQVQEAVGVSFDAERSAEGGDPDRIVSQDEMDERAVLLRRCFGLIAPFYENDAHPAVRQGPMTLAQVQLAFPAGHWTFSSGENLYAFHITGSDSLTGQSLKEDLQFQVNAQPTAACPSGVANVRRVAVNNVLGNGRDALTVWTAVATAANAHRIK